MVKVKSEKVKLIIFGYLSYLGTTTTMKLNAGYRHYNTTPFGISAMGGYLKKIIKYVKILNSILVNQIYKIILVSLFGLSEK